MTTFEMIKSNGRMQLHPSFFTLKKAKKKPIKGSSLISLKEKTKNDSKKCVVLQELVWHIPDYLVNNTSYQFY